MNGITKKCTKCGEEKGLEEFFKSPRGKHARKSQCKTCTYELRRGYNKKYRLANRDKINEKYRKYRKDNYYVLSEKAKIWELKNKEKRLAQNIAWRKENKERLELVLKKWRKNNPREEYPLLKDVKEKMKICSNKWYQANKTKDSYKKMRRDYQKKVRSTTKGTINHRMSTSIGKSLRGSKNRLKWQALAGYSIDDLKHRLEEQFTSDMTWEAFMNGEIHIDHIRPKSSFNYVSVMDEQFRMCWALDNLQPLWAEDNIIKKDKWEEVGRE